MDGRKEEEQLVRELWMKRIEDGESHPGGVRAYCLESQIVLARFYYWRKKLKPKVDSSPVECPAENFILAEVEARQEPAKPSLPDPKWLAVFAVELIRGLSP